MKFGEFNVELLSDGFFSLDPGACFGIVPRPLWSRSFRENGNGRIRMALNIPLIVGRDYSAIIDTGIGNPREDKLSKIFEFSKERDLISEMRNFADPESIDFLIHSHLHFDHFGHSLDRTENGPLFRKASLVAQRKEFNGYRRPIDFTRGNYRSEPDVLRKAKKLTMNGSARITHEISVILTGGHTSGHQAVVFRNGDHEIIYLGDLAPTAFHVKPSYITAIDTYPIDTVTMKKKLISKAIRDHAICIFNHDVETPSAIISGDVGNPKIEPVQL